jgi:hypothetical protein
MNGYLGLDQADTNTPNAAAWSAWLTTRRNSLAAAWERTRVNYEVLRQVKTDLGQPFPTNNVTEQGQTVESAWTHTLDQQVLDVQEGVKFLTQVADEALAGKRRVAWDSASDSLAIERLPDDMNHLVVDSSGTNAYLASNANNTTVHGAGTVGVFPVVLVSALVAGVAALGIGYLIYEKYCDTAVQLEVTKTARTLSDAQTRCITSGQCTPEQAAALTKAVSDGAKATAEAARAAIPPTALGQTKDILTTLVQGAIVVGGLVALYELFHIVNTGMSRRQAASTPAAAK